MISRSETKGKEKNELIFNNGSETHSNSMTDALYWPSITEKQKLESFKWRELIWDETGTPDEIIKSK